MALSSSSEEHLKIIAENSRKHASYNIVVSGSSSSIVTTYNPPLDLDRSRQHEIALISLETYHSFPNIGASNNIVKYSHDNGLTWSTITIPVGFYEITATNEELRGQIPDESVTIKANIYTLKCIMTVKKNFIVDLTNENSLRSVLGFNARQSEAGRHKSENVVNILNVNKILVNLDIIGSSRVNGVEAPVVYNFFPNVAPGEKIVSTPKNIIYLPLTLHTISRMTCWVTDQNHKLLDLRGEELTIRFHIRS